MKSLFTLILTACLLFYFNYTTAENITDSLFTINDATKRLAAIELQFLRYDIKSKEAKQFRDEILEKGNPSEKLMVQWMWEDRKLAVSNSDSSISIFDRYLPKAKKINDPNLLAILYSVKANALLNTKRYSLAFENYLYAYDNLKKDPAHHYYGQAWLLYNIAFNFYLFKDYSKTIEVANELPKLPVPTLYKPQWFNSLYFDLIGMAYFRNQQYDSAKHWFEKVHASAIQIQDSAWIGIAQGNIGKVYHAQQQPDKAIPVLKTAIEYCARTGYWDNVAPFAISLADIYLTRGELHLAGVLLDTAQYANRQAYKTDNQLEYFNVAVKYAKANRNATLAFELIDSVRKYEKIIAKDFETSKKALAESRLAYQKQSMDNELLKQKANSGKWRMYAMMVIMILLIAAFMLLIKRQKLKYSLKQKILQNQKLEAEKELSAAILEIKEFATHITEKNRSIEGLVTQIHELKAQNSEENIPEVNALEDIRQSVMLTEEGWKDFNVMFEKAYPGFISKFRAKLPELDDRGRRYFKLLKLGLNKKDIAGMLGTDDAGISQLREELVGKLELTDDGEIEILLESL